MRNPRGMLVARLAVFKITFDSKFVLERERNQK